MGSCSHSSQTDRGSAWLGNLPQGHKELLGQPCFSLYRMLPAQCSPSRPAPASTANPPGCGCVPTQLAIWFPALASPHPLPETLYPVSSHLGPHLQHCREDSLTPALWGALCWEHYAGSTPHSPLHPPSPTSPSRSPRASLHHLLPFSWVFPLSAPLLSRWMCSSLPRGKVTPQTGSSCPSTQC